MRSSNKYLISLLTASVLVSPIAMADKNIEKRLQSVTINLSEAIAIAEKATGGIAYEAELEKNTFEPEYEIEVYADGIEYEVSVNAVTSEVISIREDK